MKTRTIGILAILAITASTGWCGLVTFEDNVNIGVQMGDWWWKADLTEYTYTHTVGPEVDLNTVSAGQLVIDARKVHESGSSISFNTVSLIADDGSYVNLGELTANALTPGVMTVIDFTGSNLATLVNFLQSNDTVAIKVQCALLSEENYENLDLMGSTLKITYDDGEQPAPVPEPATLVLALGGLIGLVGASRRRR